MKIVMHCVYYPPEVGGLESHVAHLARALVGKGHEVEMITSLSRPGLPRTEVVDGVRIHRTWFPSRDPMGWALHAFGSLPRTLERARGADILHAQAFASVPPLLVAKKLLRIPLVTTFHTSHFLVRARSPRWRPVLGRLVSRSDRALAASAEIAEVAEGLAPGRRVEALTNGVDVTLFTPERGKSEPPARRHRMIVPRRLFPKNGVEILVRAMPGIRRALPGAEAVLVGDGPERGRLEALARELGVADAVRFLGARPHAELPELLRSAEVAIIPSYMEATSVAALEAMACGLPVVASDVGGLPEIVSREVGALVPPGEPDALADAVIGLLGDPARGAKGAEGRRRVSESWSNDRLALRHLEIYRELLDGKETAR